MINCANCGHPVPDNQRFCGNCGSDVLPAVPIAPPGTPIGDGQTAPYAYNQPTGYGYESQPFSEPARPANRMLIVIAVLILAACCALACGILIGFEASPILFPVNPPGPTPRVSPTREGLQPLFDLLRMM